MSPWILYAVLTAPLGAQAVGGASDIRRIDVPARSGALAPSLCVSDRGVVLSWLVPTAGRRHALRCSVLDHDRWGEPKTIVEGDRFFANWADFPSMIQGKDGVFRAHWLQRSGLAPYAYDARVRTSHDLESWEDLGKLHADDTMTEHGFVSFVREGRGVRAFWLDGRAMKRENGTMALYTAIAGRPDSEEAIDPKVCTCCQTAATVTPEGPVVVYRDHADDELRDISIVRRTENGWTKPATVYRDGWSIAACPVNGPAIDCRGRVVAVASYTGVGDGRVWVAFSNDAGASFQKPIVIDDARPLGRVAVVSVQDGAIACWLGRDGDRAELRLRRVAPDGRTGRVLTVTTSTAARASGFPRIARSGDRLVVAWRSKNPRPTVRSAVLDIEGVPPIAGKR